MIVWGAIWTHYCSNNASWTIRKQTKNKTKTYGDIACDIHFCCLCRCCVSLVCSDRLFWRPFKSSHAFELRFERPVNTYKCNSNQAKEDKLIILLFFFFSEERSLLSHHRIFHRVTVVLNHSCLLLMRWPGIIERIVWGSTTPMVRYLDVRT